MIKSYDEFLQSKIRIAQKEGFDLDLSDISPKLKDHNKLMVKWLVEGGRRACFASFGLHKTVTQLEAIRCTLLKTGGRGLIIAPLGVRAEFSKDAVNILGWDSGPKFIRRIDEASETGIYITNYETVRDGKLDPRLFQVASLDEASILRGLGGSKTFREFMRLFTGDAGPNGDRRGTECVPYRFVATATPSPNDYIELLAYADFLGVMDVSQAKTRFFKRDSTKADKLTLHAHKEEEFWLWVSSWALFVSKPSDITGEENDDAGYILPPLDIRWHEIASDHSDAGNDKRGQYQMYNEVAIGLEGSAKEKRKSLRDRVNKMLELRDQDINAHRILWHDLEDERRLIEKSIPGCKSVFGSQKLELREEIVLKFSNGELQELAGKPSMLGSGTNLQKHCSWAIYLGIGFKFNDFIQSIHRLLRFGQTGTVRIDLIYTEAEREIRKQLERKWKQHNLMVIKMTNIIKEYGLSQSAMAQHLARKIGVERIEIKGNNFTAVQNDNIKELPLIESNSVGLILSSIPFANQYEYSPNYADYGHTSNTEEFFAQMDYSTPEAFRVLQPGRIAAIHVKDRIIPGGLSGLGFQTVYPFHIDTVNHYRKHGFEYMGMKTIVTDVVRENNQTYRLGWTEQCKDGSKMGVGMPEYLLYFRKPPSDTSNAYADIPVVKEKREFDHKIGEFNNRGYSRARWQMDAHGYTRSSGERLLIPDEVAKLEHDQIYKLFRSYSLNEVWDFEQVVSIAENLEIQGKLPSGFMLLQPQSWSSEVWTDITRMRTLNGSQWSLGKEMHICPMQFDIADRVIEQMSNPGDLVLDYFGGLMTVPLRAIKKGRRGYGIELNPTYFLDGANYLKAEELKQNVPTLFDLNDVA
ncbi:DNA methyltransferase [Flavobacterium sp. 1355]|uniref:DNA methyltransferase n=1 Tax=Flavobacterium sp. 1355 TaxID=2806571 RepID=UPI001B522BA1|nr:DNA methyltransferase [Flavobacterium sp. 1355]MBP1222622.1 DNA modification methylase [Flavobacterium sp. 1355]